MAKVKEFSLLVLVFGMILVVSSINGNLPKQTTISAGCNVQAECPLPTKNECPNFLVGCIANSCVYDKSVSVACNNELVTILMQENKMNKTIEVEENTNTFTFTQNAYKSYFNIGDSKFTAGLPTYLCEKPNVDILQAPNPSSSCWETTINYGGKSYSIKDSSTISIGVITILYHASGSLVVNPEFKQGSDTTPFRNDNWGNHFVFTIDTPNALKLNVEDSSYVLKDSQKSIKLNLLNNLPSGNILIKARQTAKQTNQIFPEQTIVKKINNGNNEFTIPLDTGNYGINQISIQAFYIINADNAVYLPSSKFILNYNVVDKIPVVSNPVIVEEENQPSTPTPEPEFQTFFVIGLIILAILLFIKILKK